MFSLICVGFLFVVVVVVVVVLLYALVSLSADKANEDESLNVIEFVSGLSAYDAFSTKFHSVVAYLYVSILC